MMIIVSF